MRLPECSLFAFVVALAFLSVIPEVDLHTAEPAQNILSKEFGH
jgi:hypothetical protein